MASKNSPIYLCKNKKQTKAFSSTPVNVTAKILHSHLSSRRSLGIQMRTKLMLHHYHYLTCLDLKREKFRYDGPLFESINVTENT